jgi:hypothetical protein
MSEDKSDKKLPVRYHKTETAPTRVDGAHAPAAGRSLLGRIFSGFISDLNKATLERNTKEVKARSDHAHAVSELHDALTERDRKIEHYLQHRDDLIADDHERHLDEMGKIATHASTRAKSANTSGNWRGNAGSRNSIRRDLRQRQRGSDLMCSIKRFLTGKKSLSKKPKQEPSMPKSIC